MYGCILESQARYWPCRGISRKEKLLSNLVRLLWEQHVYWTRLVISGIVFDSPDLEVTQNRLLRNPVDFAEVLSTFYGEEAAEEFADLFTAHLTIAAQLVSAAKAGNAKEAAALEQSWYENANEIAEFFADINPYWMVRDWKEMLYSHLVMTKQEAEDFISGNYADSVDVFDRIEQEAMEMADMMTRGIVLQFPTLFQ